MNKNPYQAFSHYEVPLSDFDRARQQIATPFDSYDVDLSVARVNEILNLSGDFIYIDMASTGYATIELNNQQDAPKAPFLVRKGFALGATFKQVKISNNAQAGAFLRIMYSTGERVIPALGDVNISGSVNTVDTGLNYGGAYKAGTNMAANTPDTIFAPGANVNGAIVWVANLWAYSGTQPCLPTLIAKNGAPASVVDGDVIASVINGQNGNGAQLVRPVMIAAGKGLYCIDNFLSAYAMRSVLYSLL